MVKYTLLYICIVLGFGYTRAQGNVDTRIAVNNKTDDKTFVMIIANEDYKHEETVAFAKNDGEVFKVYCEKTLGIPERNISFTANATLNEMYYELDHLEEVLDAYDGTARAIIYYTGHGMPDENNKETYLLPIDGYSKKPSSGMSTRSFYEKLGKMNTKNIMVFLDACFSGARRDGKMLNSSRGVAMKVRQSPVGDNTVVFSAAQGDETAYPFDSQRHGMFTYYVLDKMQQSGGCTTLGELSDYVTQQVKRNSVVVNRKRQTPSVLASENNKNWRNWQFASAAAKKIEIRSVAQTRPVQASHSTIPANTATRQETPVQHTTPARTQSSSTPSSPAMSMSAGANLVVAGKSAMRALKYDKAKANFMQAAQQGNIEANYYLGELYYNGNGVAKSFPTAKSYFQKAANAGLADAQYMMGVMVRNGQGGDKNITEAKFWLQKAAAQGNTNAERLLNQLK